jgi:hypothetical protein
MILHSQATKLTYETRADERDTKYLALAADFYKNLRMCLIR